MREVGEAMGKPHTYVQKWENGDRQINPIDLRDLCTALGISFVEFLQELDEELEAQSQVQSPAKKKPDAKG